MGLIKAAMGAASGVMGDQWKEYFYCDALPAEVLAVKGQKRTNGRSANRHGSENVISDGSVIAVADGQCVLIVEQGKVVDMCAEPGEYTYDTGSAPASTSTLPSAASASTATGWSTPSCFTPMSAAMWKTPISVRRWTASSRPSC